MVPLRIKECLPRSSFMPIDNEIIVPGSLSYACEDTLSASLVIASEEENGKELALWEKLGITSKCFEGDSGGLVES
jgi:hypothetical protein